MRMQPFEPGFWVYFTNCLPNSAQAMFNAVTLPLIDPDPGTRAAARLEDDLVGVNIFERVCGNDRLYYGLEADAIVLWAMSAVETARGAGCLPISHAQALSLARQYQIGNG
jgi:hypothetical protein